MSTRDLIVQCGAKCKAAVLCMSARGEWGGGGEGDLLLRPVCARASFAYGHQQTLGVALMVMMMMTVFMMNTIVTLQQLFTTVENEENFWPRLMMMMFVSYKLIILRDSSSSAPGICIGGTTM